MLITRRHWATLMAAVPLVAQVAPPPPQSAPAPPASASDDVRRISAQLAQMEVPASVEPAFTFHAL